MEEGGIEGKGREVGGEGEGKGRAPNNFSHPQFRISRNMPVQKHSQMLLHMYRHCKQLILFCTH